jgi:predicted RNA-binding Zn ribbon-like protein
MNSRPEPAALERPVANRIAGNLALDFCNTAGEHMSAQPQELMADWEGFVRWAAQAGVITADAYEKLVRKPLPIRPILELRESIYRVGLALAKMKPVPEDDLRAIRRQADGPRPQVVRRGDGLHWMPDSERASAQLRTVLGGEALSLFCSPRARRIGICEGGLCGWIFLDDSRGKRRRWCDMNDCGSRAKARQYYARQRGA